MRLIDADELLETFEKYIEPTVCDGLYWGYRHHVVTETILRAKTVDAAQVVHGRWEPHPKANRFERCSVCHDCIIYDDWGTEQKWQYCPNCGAKMDKEENR